MTTEPPVAFRFKVRVYWEDTDAGGVVFYANYLRFFERARTEWLRAHGVGQEAMRQSSGRVFVVTDTSVRFRAPARLDAEIEITVAVLSAGPASMRFAQAAWCGDRLLAEGSIRVGCVDAVTFRPQRIPEEVLAAMSAPATRESPCACAPPTDSPPDPAE